MNVTKLVETLGLDVVSGPFEREIAGVYVGDLLSNVMAKAERDNLWITIQGHQNVVAVASLTEVAAVIVVEDFELEEVAIERAQERQVNILRTPLTAYELVKKLINLGI
ncbi:MAG: DRTGG domain-containing protein [Bacillota bacterium]|jgi:serine kinase of HPr protein (carbohydrate metabolism regulator)|nr:DRTGG domain-containing protein [Bacillota bacterium]